MLPSASLDTEYKFSSWDDANTSSRLLSKSMEHFHNLQIESRIEKELSGRDIPLAQIPLRCIMKYYPHLSAYHKEFYIDDQFIFSTQVIHEEDSTRLIISEERIADTNVDKHHIRSNVDGIQSERSDSPGKPVLS